MAVKDEDMIKEPAKKRISANDTAKPAKKARPKAAAEQTTPQKERRMVNPLRLLVRMLLGVGGYFKGAWFELRQVRWPNRRATFGMTGALLGFTAFFTVFILLIDALFQYLFKLMLG